MKMFPNTLALPESIIHKRLIALDPEATLVYYRIPSALDQSYVGIESETLTDEDIITMLTTPLTEAELAAIDRKQHAFANAQLTAEMKSITIPEARVWIDANVNDLAAVKGMLKILASMVIAIRDEVFPELPES